MVDFVKLSNKRTNSVRSIEELLVEFVPQTFTCYFRNFSAESQPAIRRDTNDNLYLPIPQYFQHIRQSHAINYD